MYKDARITFTYTAGKNGCTPNVLRSQLQRMTGQELTDFNYEFLDPEERGSERSEPQAPSEPKAPPLPKTEDMIHNLITMARQGLNFLDAMLPKGQYHDGA